MCELDAAFKAMFRNECASGKASGHEQAHVFQLRIGTLHRWRIASAVVAHVQCVMCGHTRGILVIIVHCNDVCFSSEEEKVCAN